MRRLVAIATLVCTPFGLAGCMGDDSNAGGPLVDGGVDASLATDASAPPLPQLRRISTQVLASPTVVPIVYASDDGATRASITDFVAKLTASDYVRATTYEYGVGSFASVAPVVITDPPPVTIDDGDVQTWIASHLGAWPQPTDAIYVVFYPAGTTVTLSNVSAGEPARSCVDFGGYHGDIGGAVVTSYAVIPRCASYLGHGGIDHVTSSASHEILEAATDPLPYRNPAWNDVDFDGSGWAAAASGAEVVDLCKLAATSTFPLPGTSYPVQRAWSNTMAAAGHDPCVPHDPAAGPYFGAFPQLEGVQIGPNQYVSGVRVAPGETRTIAVRLFSDAPTSGPWTVSAAENGAPSAMIAGDASLSFAWDRTTGQAGDVLHLTITRAPAPAPRKWVPFVIESTLGGATNDWWSVVGE